MTEVREYHSALAPDYSDAFPRDWWAMDGNMAFVHDFANGFPPEFGDADFIYGEPPWKDGYEEFNRRAGVVDAIPFPELMYRLNRSLANCGRPWMALVGAAGLRALGCEWMVRCRLNGSVAALIGAGGPPPPVECRDAADVVGWITGNPLNGVIADFCAGYGRTAKAATLAGKKFIATDYNATCVGHIAREYLSWK